MAALPYMQLYVADYLADTSHLSTLEHGAYLLLIMNYWQRGKPLPAADEKVARIAHLSLDEWLEVKPAIIEFFTERDGLLHHKRIDRDLQYVADKSEQAASAGRASAAKRWGDKRVTDVITDVERTSNHTDTDTDTDTEREADTDGASAPARPLTVHQQAYIKPFSQIAATLNEPDLKPTSKRLKVLANAMHNAEVGGFANILAAANNLARSPAPESIKRYDWLLNGFDYAERITEYLTAKNNSTPRARKYAPVPDDWDPNYASTAATP